MRIPLRRLSLGVKNSILPDSQDHHPAWSQRWFNEAWPLPKYGTTYHECVKRLGEFPNVRSVVVHFDRHAGFDGDKDILQDPDFQRLWLRRILNPLNERLSRVSLRHYQNTGDETSEGRTLSEIKVPAAEPRTQTPILKSTLSGLTSLRMSVKHPEIRGVSGDNPRSIHRVCATNAVPHNY
jgi:hypothetical protein